jgi:hypothetical protein
VQEKRTHRAKLRKWLGAGALALVCVYGSVRPAAAQTSTSTTTTPTSSKSKTHAATAGKSSKTTAKNSTSGKSPSRPAVPPSTGKSSRSSSTARSGKSAHASSRRGSKKKLARGQQKIDSERALAIQEALIREHYLSGQASGSWNDASEAAMRRYQADHGWQSKTVPDSRALISLGLGPSNDHLLNPESAMTSVPPSPHAASLTPVSHSADPGARVSKSPAASPDAQPAASSEHNAPSPQ